MHAAKAKQKVFLVLNETAEEETQFLRIHTLAVTITLTRKTATQTPHITVLLSALVMMYQYIRFALKG